jgi:hypothetical protein
MASKPKARTESATIQNGTQLLIETRRSAKSVWLYFCTKYFLLMATASGDFARKHINIRLFLIGFRRWRNPHRRY